MQFLSLFYSVRPPVRYTKKIRLSSLWKKQVDLIAHLLCAMGSLGSGRSLSFSNPNPGSERSRNWPMITKRVSSRARIGILGCSASGTHTIST